MSDFRSEIPTRAFINALIIEDLRGDPAFDAAVERTLSKIRLPIGQYQFVNPAHLISLLYCLIVVPKEIWFLRENDMFYQRLEREAKILDLFKPSDIETTDSRPDDRTAYRLVHRLRNAVAHANFSIDSSQAFEFWDTRPKQDKPHWSAKITSADLLKLLNWLGQNIERIPKTRHSSG